jgi:hypothetical protein
LRLIGLRLISLRLIGLRPRSFSGAGRYPGIVFGRAAPRRDVGGLAAHPVRHVRHVLARGSAGARSQQHTADDQKDPFEFREGTLHLEVLPQQCGFRDAQSRPRCDNSANARDHS